MLQNYFRTAFRSMRRHPAFTFINVFGLSVGLAVCLLILSYLRMEFGFDRFFEDADRIFRITTRETVEGRAERVEAQAPMQLAQLIRQEVPGVELSARVVSAPDRVVSAGGEPVLEPYSLTAEPDFLPIFGMELLRGDAAEALVAPYSVVMTRRLGQKYFGDADPLGRELLLDREPYTVTGVVENLATESHLKFDFVTSYSTRRARNGDELMDEIEANWRAWTTTYVKLASGVAATQAATAINGIAASRTEQTELSISLDLQPLSDIHLGSSHMTGLLQGESPGNPQQLVLLGAIALFILLLACINFVNLSTAKATTRSREVGVRKAAGASRQQLVTQFMGEAMLVASIAFVLALLIADTLLPVFNQIMDSQLQDSFVKSSVVMAVMGGVLLVTGVLAGLYPALVLSSYKPTNALKGGQIGPSRPMLRRSLVAFQLVVSIILITGTMIVREQMEFVQSRDLGYDSEQILIVRSRDYTTFPDQYESFKQELLTQPGVVGVSGSTSFGALGALDPFGTEPEGEQLDFQWIGIDYDFVETTGLDLIAGSDLRPDVGENASGAVLLNEKAVQSLEWTSDEAIGRTITYNRRNLEIVGVVKDFHQASLHEPVQPIVLYSMHARARPFVVVRMAGSDVSGTLASIGQTWSRFVPDLPFEYLFLDDKVQQQYEADARFERIFTVSSGIAISIACLGLFGLAAFAAQRRTKEIGIRKTLGANALQIFSLLSSEFVVLTLAAFALAAPVAWLGLQSWLENFSYRADVGAGVFLAAAVLVMGITLATVSWQTIRAATSDPVKALRYE